MKKLCFLLIVVGAFAFTAMAQTSAQTSSTSGQKSSKTSKSSGDHSGMAMDNKTSSGKSSTLTGCLSSSANSEGMYTLSNGRYKKGVEVGPADKVKDHAGHQVALTGKWSTAAEAGETNAAAGKEKGERHFEVDSVKHISDTCSTAPGGGTTGSKSSKGSKSKTSDASSAPKQL